jgi:hypothetical protein
MDPWVVLRLWGQVLYLTKYTCPFPYRICVVISYFYEICGHYHLNAIISHSNGHNGGGAKASICLKNVASGTNLCFFIGRFMVLGRFELKMPTHVRRLCRKAAMTPWCPLSSNELFEPHIATQWHPCLTFGSCWVPCVNTLKGGSKVSLIKSLQTVTETSGTWNLEATGF